MLDAKNGQNAQNEINNKLRKLIIAIQKCQEEKFGNFSASKHLHVPILRIFFVWCKILAKTFLKSGFIFAFYSVYIYTYIYIYIFFF